MMWHHIAFTSLDNTTPCSYWTKLYLTLPYNYYAIPDWTVRRITLLYNYLTILGDTFLDIYSTRYNITTPHNHITSRLDALWCSALPCNYIAKLYSTSRYDTFTRPYWIAPRLTVTIPHLISHDHTFTWQYLNIHSRDPTNFTLLYIHNTRRHSTLPYNYSTTQHQTSQLLHIIRRYDTFTILNTIAPHPAVASLHKPE